MSELVELSYQQHSDLKVDPNCAIDIAKNQHVVNLRVTEVGKAVTDFPVFFTKVTESGIWAISAVTCLELDSNLFVRDGKWDAVYMPTGLQTYPFFIIQSPEDEKKISIGIDPENAAFSTDKGEPLFEAENKAGVQLSRATAMLQQDMTNDIHTYQFAQRMEELGLLKEVTILVQYEDETVNSLKGLMTINEEKLAELTTEELESLHKKGYLPPIYSMLISIYQLNKLISRNNALPGARQVKQIQIEVVKPEV